MVSTRGCGIDIEWLMVNVLFKISNLLIYLFIFLLFSKTAKKDIK